MVWCLDGVREEFLEAGIFWNGGGGVNDPIDGGKHGRHQIDVVQDRAERRMGVRVGAKKQQTRNAFGLKDIVGVDEMIDQQPGGNLSGADVSMNQTFDVLQPYQVFLKFMHPRTTRVGVHGQCIAQVSLFGQVIHTLTVRGGNQDLPLSLKDLVCVVGQQNPIVRIVDTNLQLRVDGGTYGTGQDDQGITGSGILTHS